MRLVMAWFVVGVLAACNPTPEQEAHDVCQALCDCRETLPSKVNACIEQCVPQVPATLPDECVTCVYTYSQSCGELISQCINDVCQSPTP